MKKALIVSTVSRQFTLFERGNIEILKKLGYEVHCAANYSDATEALEELDIVSHHIDIERSPFSINQFKAYSQLKKLMTEQGFDLVHCHAPMGGVIGRLAAKSVGVKNVFYTAHGFHFFKGAPKINWIIYYPIEKFLSKYTNSLITINEEDYRIAVNRMKAKNVYHIPGIGLDIDKISSSTKSKKDKRREFNIPDEVIVLVSVGELNKNKNHEMIIKVISKLTQNNVHYYIAGKGSNYNYLNKLAKDLGIKEKVHFMGFRDDIHEIYKMADIFCFPSFREGLSVSLMEAMASGLPCVVSNIRGNVDLIKDGKGGYLYSPNDIEGFECGINSLVLDRHLRANMGENNIEAVKEYDIEIVKKAMIDIYS